MFCATNFIPCLPFHNDLVYFCLTQTMRTREGSAGTQELLLPSLSLSPLSCISLFFLSLSHFHSLSATLFFCLSLPFSLPFSLSFSFSLSLLCLFRVFSLSPSVSLSHRGIK